MRVKLTPWEERNLGVAGCEFYIDANDTVEDFLHEIHLCTAKYQVLHIETGNTDVLLSAQQEGFQFIEMNIQISRKLKPGDDLLPKIYKRFENYLSYEIGTEGDIERALSIVATGDMFVTDKISRDPYFGKNFAGRRYALWSQDVLNQGAKLLLTKYKDDNLGFVIVREESNHVFDLFLGGVFPEYSNKGLGFAGLYLELKYISELGGGKIFSGVSSNNLPILKLHELFGFCVESTSYILFRHI